MDVAFASVQLRDLCASHSDLVRRYGDRQARRIAQRLQTLRVALDLTELKTMPGRLHPLVADRTDCFALDLIHPKRLVFEVDVNDGCDVWTARAATVVVLEIVDYH